MEESKPPVQCAQHFKLTVGTIVSYFLHSLVVGVLMYGGLYIAALSRSVEHLQQDNRALQTKIQALEKVCGVKSQNIPDTVQAEKREIISKENLSQLIRGPPGPPGPPGKDGRDGSPGKDYSSLTLLRQVINETVQKEWKGLSNSLPNYGGMAYIRWGRNSCPASSNQIYRGYMAGSAFFAEGGGANYQCLTTDPEYDSKSYTLRYAPAPIRPMQYEIVAGPNMFGSGLLYEYVPCVACETKQRVTQATIPGKTRCPSSDWTLDYQGYIMSEIVTGYESHHVSGRGRGSFVCIDSKAEKSPPPMKSVGQWNGGVLYPVSVDCWSDFGSPLLPCPPYRNNTALSCVVCSK